MFKRILVSTDGSELATQAVDKGIALAAGMSAAATVMMVTEPFHILSTDSMQVESTRASYDADATAHANRVLQAARQGRGGRRFRADTSHLA